MRPCLLGLNAEALGLKRLTRSRGSPSERVSTIDQPATLTPTAQYVLDLARTRGISYAQTYADIWANAVTKLAGDEVRPDATDDLLVALARAGKVTPEELVKLTMAHHRELKNV